LTATSWVPTVSSCPEGPTRLDREIRVGAPARRADGPERRTAGRWVCAAPVAVVRSKRPSGRRTRLSRARLGKAVGVPRGTDDPQGPNRPGAGGFAHRQPDGALGGCLCASSALLTGARTGRPRQDRPAASASKKTDAVLRRLRGESLEERSCEVKVGPHHLAAWRDDCRPRRQARPPRPQGLAA